MKIPHDIHHRPYLIETDTGFIVNKECILFLGCSNKTKELYLKNYYPELYENGF